MQSVVSILFVFSIFFSQDLKEVREQYYEASKSKSKAEEFYNSLSKYNKENQTLLAYKGAAIALKAKFATDAKKKKALFIEGVNFIETAIKSDPNNLEIRIIRLSIQENTPKVLKYKSNISEDKNLISKHFARQNQALKDFIATYIRQSKAFSEAEKQTLLK